MRFTPKSADEIAEAGLLPDGDYDYEVISATDEISKSSGNEMIVLNLKVFDANGGSRTVRDYLVASEGGIRKVRAFAVSCGRLTDYDAGLMEAADLQGSAGRCKIGRDQNEGYEPKNRVAYYLDPAKQRSGGIAAPVVRRSAPARQPVPVGGGDIDDEIPFGPEWR